MRITNLMACIMFLGLAACAGKPGLVTAGGEQAGESFHIAELEIVPADGMRNSTHWNDLFKDEIQELKDKLPARLMPRLGHATGGEPAKLLITVKHINLYTNAVKTLLIGDRLEITSDLEVRKTSDNSVIGSQMTGSFSNDRGGWVAAMVEGFSSDESQEEDKIRLMDAFSTSVITHLYPSRAAEFPGPPAIDLSGTRPKKHPALVDDERPALYDAPVPGDDQIPPLRLPQ
jgi:hypothetical protein